MWFRCKKKIKNKAEEIQISEYYSDSPIILNNQNDIFGTYKIKEQIESIVDVIDVSQESYVIGLQGKRGSGKSSIIKSLNFTTDKYIVFHYSPRIYGNEANLYEKFFDELSLYLGSTKFCSDKSIKKDLLNYKIGLLKSFNGSLKKGILKLLKGIIDFISGSIGVVLLIKFWEILSVCIIVLGITLLVILSIYLLVLAYQIYINFRIWDYYNSYTSIDGIKREISKKLGNLNKKIIIIIDDIDRLKSDKISNIFQLVKSTANFNNIIYILCYDKDIIKNAFEKEYQQGEKYIDKFVQMELSLPKITFYGISNYLLTNTFEFVDYCNKKYPTINYKITEQEKTKLLSFFKSEKRRDKFTTIRDVKRFFNMLKSDFNILHSKHKSEEIYIFDFIIIEFIKYIDEGFYNWIYKTVGYIFNGRSYQGGRVIVSLEESINGIIEKDYNGWSEVFSTLFPIYQNSITCDNERKISNPDIFDCYFSFIISGFTNTLFKEIIGQLKSNLNVKEIINELNDNDYVRDFINKIFFYIRECDYNNYEEVSNVILLICFLINYENKLNNYSILLGGIEYDISRCLIKFLSHFITDPDNYKKYFKEIFNNVQEYAQIYDYTYEYLNTDYKILKEQYKPQIYNQIISGHQNLGEKNILELQKLVKDKFLELFNDNTLHEINRWECSIKIAKILGWINQKNCYNYLHHNSLSDKFIRSIILGSSSAYYKKECGKDDIDLFIRAGKLYFNKKQFNENINKYEWDEYEQKILKDMIKNWK